MESLALAAAVIVLTVYLSGVIAFVASWFRNRFTYVLTYLLSAFSIATGIWLGITLRDGNGIFLAMMPISLGFFSVWNVKRRKQISTDS